MGPTCYGRQTNCSVFDAILSSTLFVFPAQVVTPVQEMRLEEVKDVLIALRHTINIYLML